ncbi:hypothetical protein WI845_02745 [Vibrio cholerae]
MLPVASFLCQKFLLLLAQIALPADGRYKCDERAERVLELQARQAIFSLVVANWPQSAALQGL